MDFIIYAFRVKGRLRRSVKQEVARKGILPFPEFWEQQELARRNRALSFLKNCPYGDVTAEVDLREEEGRPIYLDDGTGRDDVGPESGVAAVSLGLLSFNPFGGELMRQRMKRYDEHIP